jgi:hypothetical protein
MWNRKKDNENNCYKGDDKLWYFLFMLSNLHVILTWKLVLRVEKKHYTICCSSKWNSTLNENNIHNFDNCDTKNDNRTYFDIFWCEWTYANNIVNKEFLINVAVLIVKGIEILEITNYIWFFPVNFDKCSNGYLFQEMAENAIEHLFETVTSHRLT